MWVFTDLNANTAFADLVLSHESSVEHIMKRVCVCVCVCVCVRVCCGPAECHEPHARDQHPLLPDEGQPAVLDTEGAHVQG